jgi:peptide/nickel transport system substrate-binding protein
VKKSRTAASALAAVTVSGLLAASGAYASASPLAAATGGGTLKVLTSSYADSLDPSFGYTTQAIEPQTAVYVPLVTYAHKTGLAGTLLIPGLATALPTVSANGLTYNLTLRKGLTYSDGTPIKASDFAFAIQRAIALQWGGDSFYTGYIKGAAAFAAKKATSISGIVTNDTTGAITITLTQPYGAFANVLAFESAAPIPSTTPMKVESANPPIGDGPYKFASVVPNVSYKLVRNPTFATFKIPNLPTGNVNEIDTTVDSNTITEAQQVIGGQADVFDPADTLPASEISAAQALPKSRYTTTPIASTYYFFMNTKIAPFNNTAVRQAVEMSVDRTALARLAAGFQAPTCYLLPPNFPGHPTAPCPGGSPNQSPSAAVVAKAKAAIKAAGDVGMPVTVWSQTKQSRQVYQTYYTSLLNTLGFKATLKTVQDSTYFQQIGAASNKPQTGFADWSQDFPNPSDFYLLLDARSIQATNNENFGNVNDPYIQAQLKKLEAVPASKLSSVASQWAALDEYVTKKAYIVPFGNTTVPLLFSSNVTNGPASFNGVFYIDFASIKLK